MVAQAAVDGKANEIPMFTTLLSWTRDPWLLLPGAPATMAPPAKQADIAQALRNRFTLPSMQGQEGIAYG